MSEARRLKITGSQSEGVKAAHGLTIEITCILSTSQKTMSTPLHNKKELAEIRKESLDIYNRIHSVAEDALFVERVAEHYGEYPVIRAIHSLSSPGPDLNGGKQRT
jgi:hypothetical protein